MLRVGAWIARNGTVIRIVRGVSADLPVSGFVAVTSNWLLPRRSSTSTFHEPSAAAVARYGWATPGEVITIVEPGVDVPARRYAVVTSSTTMTAWAGLVTARSGALA